MERYQDDFEYRSRCSIDWALIVRWGWYQAYSLVLRTDGRVLPRTRCRLAESDSLAIAHAAVEVVHYQELSLRLQWQS